MSNNPVETIETDGRGGRAADLVLVDGSPLDDVGLLADPAHIVAVVQGGDVVNDVYRRGLPADRAERHRWSAGSKASERS